MATQNPLEMEGTYPLPEAQLDRFLLKALVPFPSADDLVTVLERTTGAVDDQPSTGRRRGDAAGDDRAHPPGADRQPRAAPRRRPRRRHAARRRPATPSASPATCASAPRPAAPRRWCWRARCGRCSTGARASPSTTSAPSRRRRCATGSSRLRGGRRRRHRRRPRRRRCSTRCRRRAPACAARTVTHRWPSTPTSCCRRPLLAQLERLQLRTRRRLAGRFAGEHRSPHFGVVGRLRRLPRVPPRRRLPAHRLPAVRPHRAPVPPPVRGRGRRRRCASCSTARRRWASTASSTRPCGWPRRSASSRSLRRDTRDAAHRAGGATRRAGSPGATPPRSLFATSPRSTPPGRPTSPRAAGDVLGRPGPVGVTVVISDLLNEGWDRRHRPARRPRRRHDRAPRARRGGAAPRRSAATSRWSTSRPARRSRSACPPTQLQRVHPGRRALARRDRRPLPQPRRHLRPGPRRRRPSPTSSSAPGASSRSRRGRMSVRSTRPGLALLALAVPVVLAHVLRPRRTPMTVSSILLWRRLERPVSAAQPWQRLRWSLLLLAQLLAVAAARRSRSPGRSGWRRRRSPQHTVFIIDASGSMAATDGSPDRLADAATAPSSSRDELPRGGVASVVVAADTARVALTASADDDEFERALRTIDVAPRAAPTSPTPSPSPRASRRAPRRSASCFVTDGGLTAEEAALLPAGTRIERDRHATPPTGRSPASPSSRVTAGSTPGCRSATPAARPSPRPCASTSTASRPWRSEVTLGRRRAARRRARRPRRRAGRGVPRGRRPARRRRPRRRRRRRTADALDVLLVGDPLFWGELLDVDPRASPSTSPTARCHRPPTATTSRSTTASTSRPTRRPVHRRRAAGRHPGRDGRAGAGVTVVGSAETPGRHAGARRRRRCSAGSTSPTSPSPPPSASSAGEAEVLVAAEGAPLLLRGSSAASRFVVPDVRAARLEPRRPARVPAARRPPRRRAHRRHDDHRRRSRSASALPGAAPAGRR